MGHITLDNAANNETMMKSLEKRMAARDVSFDARDRRIMCFAHIINLCSGRVIHAASNGAGYDDGYSSSDDNAVPSNPIVRARAAVRAIRGSGERRDAFHRNIVEGNKEGWFMGQSSDIVKIKPLELLQDVRTRWDSVYHMLTRLLEMRPVRLYPHRCKVC